MDGLASDGFSWCARTVRNNQHDYTYNNEFVGCLCRGETPAGGIGNKTISASAGVCLNCRTTPGLVRKDLIVSLIVSSQASADNGLHCYGIGPDSPPAMYSASTEWNSSRCFALQASRFPYEYHWTTAIWISILSHSSSSRVASARRKNIASPPSTRMGLCGFTCLFFWKRSSFIRSGKSCITYRKVS